MTRPYTLAVGGRETKELCERRSRESMEIRGREARLRKRLVLELQIVLAEPLVPNLEPSPKRRAKK